MVDTIASQVGGAFLALGREHAVEGEFLEHFWRYPAPFTTLQMLNGIMEAYRLSGLQLHGPGWVERIYSVLMPRNDLAHNIGAHLVNTARHKRMPLEALAYAAMPSGRASLEQAFTRAYDHYLGWDNKLSIGRETVDHVTVDVDYDVPIEKLARRYRQGAGRPYALTRNFPPPRAGRAVIVVTVVGFGRRTSDDEADQWFAARGKRRTALVETLTLCEACPELLEEWIAIGGQPLSLSGASVLVVPYFSRSTPRGFTMHPAVYPAEHGHCVYYLGTAA